MISNNDDCSCPCHYEEKYCEECCSGVQTSGVTLLALISRWRREAAQIDSFHATMGTGYKVCANQLEEVLKGLSHED